MTNWVTKSDSIWKICLKSDVKIDRAPGLSREADDGKEHSVDVEITEEASDDDAVDGKRDLWYAEIETNTDDVAFL